MERGQALRKPMSLKQLHPERQVARIKAASAMIDHDQWRRFERRIILFNSKDSELGFQACVF
jgi:hypothetical protein